MTIASILWRRLDAPGHDACRLDGSDDGWKLDGAAVFREGGVPARLTYSVTCDLGWRAEQGQVHGWVGRQSVEFIIARTSGGVWTLNGAAMPQLEGCIDLDFGFTPATNLPQLRRIGLTEGRETDVPVAWLDVSGGTLTVLPQHYKRQSEVAYWYESPSVNYKGLLEISSAGFIQRYPGLWEAEP